MRARMALTVSEHRHIHREILLRDKPAEMIAASPKATVPVLQLTDGTVLEQSLDIMVWTLQNRDPLHWLKPQSGSQEDMMALIAENDGPFKHHLDRYKYANRYGEETDPLFHQQEGARFLKQLNDRLEQAQSLFGDRASLADYAIFPFVRQYANTDRAWFDSQPMSALRNWLDGHLNSDLFNTIMKKHPVWSAGTEDLFPV